MTNRCMRVMVMFDLPVNTKSARRAYTEFRRFLIKDGYDMLQFSIYCRITQNHDDARKHIDRLKKNLPGRGSVRVMSVTEKQFASMLILVGDKTAAENFLTSDDLIDI